LPGCCSISTKRGALPAPPSSFAGELDPGIRRICQSAKAQAYADAEGRIGTDVGRRRAAAVRAGIRGCPASATGTGPDRPDEGAGVFRSELQQFAAGTTPSGCPRGRAGGQPGGLRRIRFFPRESARAGTRRVSPRGHLRPARAARRGCRGESSAIHHGGRRARATGRAGRLRARPSLGSRGTGATRGRGRDALHFCASPIRPGLFLVRPGAGGRRRFGGDASSPSQDRLKIHLGAEPGQEVDFAYVQRRPNGSHQVPS